MKTDTRPNGNAPTEMRLHDGRTITMGRAGSLMFKAWQHVWDRLDHTEWRSARELSEDAAEAYDLRRVSVTEMLCRMRATGALEQKMIRVPVTYHRGGKDIVMQRPCVHYRIAKKAVQ